MAPFIGIHSTYYWLNKQWTHYARPSTTPSRHSADFSTFQFSLRSNYRVSRTCTEAGAINDQLNPTLSGVVSSLPRNCTVIDISFTDPANNAGTATTSNKGHLHARSTHGGVDNGDDDHKIVRLTVVIKTNHGYISMFRKYIHVLYPLLVNYHFAKFLTFFTLNCNWTFLGHSINTRYYYL